ncbi:hypothetical protein CI102_14086 [Trichoderma harzianum]|nr:hypothetical protein CI102_14086 [Trichoderma harzianum]
MKITKDPWIWWGREANRPLSLSAVSQNRDFCPCSLTRYFQLHRTGWKWVQVCAGHMKHRTHIGGRHVYVIGILYAIASIQFPPRPSRAHYDKRNVHIQTCICQSQDVAQKQCRKTI